MYKHAASFMISFALVMCNPAFATDSPYFPKGSLSNKESFNSFKRQWYSKHLAAMNEPSLCCAIKSAREYRFTWLRTFHHPVAVRITETADHVLLTATELDGAGGYEPGNILRREEINIPADQFESFLDLFNSGNFWSIETTAEKGLDGAEWIVEVNENGKYHAVARHSPEDGFIREIGLLFLTLTGWDFGEMY